MVQTNLKGSAVKSASEKLSKDKSSSYNRFFVNAFAEIEIDEIVEAGGSESKDNFERISESKMKKKDYWDKMFAKSFTGKDSRVRKSKFQGLGTAIYENYIKDLKPRAEIRKYTRGSKSYDIGVVPKGKTFNIQGKEYKGGRFLPKSYWGGF